MKAQLFRNLFKKFTSFYDEARLRANQIQAELDLDSESKCFKPY